MLEGEIDLHYGNEIHRVKSGDSVYYDSSEPHGLVSVGDQRTRIVAVLYSK